MTRYSVSGRGHRVVVKASTAEQAAQIAAPYLLRYYSRNIVKKGTRTALPLHVKRLYGMAKQPQK
jgi:hypothetical protein